MLYLRGVPFFRGPARSVVDRSLLRPWSRVSSCSVDANVTSVEGLEPACLRMYNHRQNRRLRIRPGQASDAVRSASTILAQNSGTILVIEIENKKEYKRLLRIPPSASGTALKADSSSGPCWLKKPALRRRPLGNNRC